MISPFMLKEANRFHWLNEGKLIPEDWSEEDIEKSYKLFMVRLWGNQDEAVYKFGSEGFEEAWKKRKK